MTQFARIIQREIEKDNESSESSVQGVPQGKNKTQNPKKRLSSAHEVENVLMCYVIHYCLTFSLRLRCLIKQ